jgi:uncharacterized protein (TIRG00374 family)
LKKLIRPLIAIILLALLFRSGLIKVDQLKSSLQNTRLLLAGFVLIGFQFLFFAYRWKIIVDIYHTVAFSKILKLNLISQFFNTFIPGGVGGDLVKAIELSKSENIPKQKTISTIVIDRVIGLYCMILFSTLFLSLEMNQLPEIKKFFYVSLIMLIISSVGLFFLSQIVKLCKAITKNISFSIVRKVIEGLETLNDGFRSVRKIKPMLQMILLSLIAQLLAIYFLHLVVASTTPDTPSFLVFFPLACFAFMASAIPITPGGIGFGQAAFYFIFSIYSKDTANAATIGVSLMQLFILLFSLPGAYFFTKIPKKDI